jgi:hypothetical protein
LFSFHFSVERMNESWKLSTLGLEFLLWDEIVIEVTIYGCYSWQL